MLISLRLQQIRIAARALVVSAIATLPAGLGVVTLTPTSAQAQAQMHFFGEIITTASNFCDGGWNRGSVEADGRLMSIDGNPALYSIFSTRYGGDGRITFEIPDIQYANNVDDLNWCLVAAGGVFPTASLDKPRNKGYVYGDTSWNYGYDSEIKIFTTGACPDGFKRLNQAPHLPSKHARGYNAANHIDTFTWCSRMSAGSGQGVIGQMHLLYNHSHECPQNTLLADGRLLSIDDYLPLFQVLSTRFGGDGRTTFGIPNEPFPANDLWWCITANGILPSRY